MSLICNICEDKADYILNVDCGRFSSHTYYCQKHRPRSFFLEEFTTECQSTKGTKRILTEQLTYKEKPSAQNVKQGDE